jgi:SAM-dependent methyltransferase
LLHRGNPGDTSFYAAHCRNSGAVLELGCGYGRLIPSLLPRRGRYVGLDIDAGLLRAARRRRSALPAETAARVVLTRGDMRAFRLRARFDRIVIAHSGLFCLPSDAAVLACLRCARAHLRPGGELILDTYAADAFHRDADPDDPDGERWQWLTQVAAGDTSYDVFERTRWRHAAQRMHVRYRYVPSDGSPPREGAIMHRYLLSGQLRDLLERAGFRVLARHGDFEGGRFRTRGDTLIVRACIASVA